MTDWDRIVADIEQAMKMVDDAHTAGEALREKPTPERVDTFQKRMRSLCIEMKNLQYLMAHEDENLTDEIADVLSEAFTGKLAPWRRAPRQLEPKEKPESSGDSSK